MRHEDNPLLKIDRDGYHVGKNPLNLTEKELLDAEYEPMPVRKAIRKKCLECGDFQPGEVRKCVVTECPLWPYRMGKNPFTSLKCKATLQKKGISNLFDTDVQSSEVQEND